MATCLAAGGRADRGLAAGDRVTCPAWDLAGRWTSVAGVLDGDVLGFTATCLAEW
jgi:hypothetical protein